MYAALATMNSGGSMRIWPRRVNTPAMSAPQDVPVSAMIGVMPDPSALGGAPVTDRFGVPDHLLGPHTDEFYGCVGRVVALSALLEDRLRVLVSRQGGVTDGPANLGTMQVFVLIRMGTARMVAFIDEPTRSLAEVFFARALWAMDERNHIVHNLLPAQDDGPHLGWRSAGDESGDIVISRSPSDLSELVLHFVQLLDDCEHLSMRVRPPQG